MHFNLLYYNEVGLVELCTDFKYWVIDILTNKTEKTITDLYDEQTLKMISKSDAFDEYLKCSAEDVKFKPTTKSKQFFNRTTKEAPLRPRQSRIPDVDVNLFITAAQAQFDSWGVLNLNDIIG